MAVELISETYWEWVKAQVRAAGERRWFVEAKGFKVYSEACIEDLMEDGRETAE